MAGGAQAVNERLAAAQALCAWLRGEAPPAADWGAVVTLAAQQGLVAVLYRRLKAARARPLLPPELWTLLQETYLDSTGRSLQRQHQAARVLRAFQAAGIAVIALKGAHLGALVYRDPALRPMQDLDVLIKPADLAQAEALLRAAGYTLYGERDEYEQAHYHFHYHRPDPAELPVELHWQLLRPATLNVALEMDELWARACPAAIAGAQALVLAPEDLLLYLCLHTAYVHLFQGGLKACYDLRQLMAHCGAALDWNAVQERARRWQVGRAVYLMLRLARKWLAADAPEAALQALVQEPDAGLLGWAEEQMVTPEPPWLPPDAEPPAFKSSNLAYCLKAGRLGDKAALVFKSLFPPPPEIARRYAVSLTLATLPFYYARNLIEMFLEHSPVVWRLLRKNALTVKQAEEKFQWDETARIRAGWNKRRAAIEEWISLT